MFIFSSTIETPIGQMFACANHEGVYLLEFTERENLEKQKTALQKALKKLVPEILDKSDDHITLRLEMLVRAYDPCISCSAHFLNVKYVNR